MYLPGVRKLLLSLILFASAALACGQTSPVPSRDADSTFQSSISSLVDKSDAINSRIDNLQKEVNGKSALDAVYMRLKRRADSSAVVSALDSAYRQTRKRVDSLSSEVSHYGQLLDSLSAIPTQSFRKRINAIEEKVEDVRVPFESKSLDVSDLGLQSEIPGTNLDIDKEFNDATITITAPLSDLKNETAEIRTTAHERIETLTSADEVEMARSKVTQANGLVDKAQSYEQDAVNIIEGDMDDVNAIPKAIEDRVSKMDGVAGLQQYQGEIDQYSAMIKQGNDLEALASIATRHALDHFAGRQLALTSAMDKMSTIGSSMPAVPSIDAVDKRSSSTMRWKNFKEKFVPGVTFQVQKAASLLLDFNPSVAWRFTERLSAGGGWNERVAYSDWHGVVMAERIFGPRVFGNFGLHRGLSVKADLERMNVFIPTYYGTMDGSRGWVWGVFAGIKKDYTFCHRIKGNIQVMYNLYDDHGNSPYMDRLNVRMGFELD